MNPMVSVVIPTLNREEPLRATLDYFLLRESYEPFEILVVDQSDAHEPETDRLLASAPARLAHVRVAYKNLSRARNHGVSLCRGDIVLFVDDDVEPAPGFLAAHAGAYADRRVSGVTGPVLRPGETLKGRWDIGEHTYAALLARSAMRFDVDFAFSASWAMGCNMSFRRATLQRLDGFDESFCDGGVATGDDAEFSHRVKKHGGAIRYEPRARLLHKVVPVGGCRHLAGSEARLLAVVQNMVYFWYKVDGSRWVRYRMFARLFRRTVCTRNNLRAGAVIRSALAFARGLAAGRYRARRLIPADAQWLALLETFENVGVAARQGGRRTGSVTRICARHRLSVPLSSDSADARATPRGEAAA